MATITGLTAARMLEIEAASVVDGDVSGDDLLLTKHDGTVINAGNVRGPAGPTGPMGSSLSVVSGLVVGDVGMGNQIKAGRQLTPADFTNMGLSVPIGLWNLANFSDQSGNGRTLTNKGSVGLAPGILGAANTAAQFTGNVGQVLYINDTGSNDPFRIKTGSWGCWLRTAKRGTHQWTLSKLNQAGTGVGSSFDMVVRNTNVLQADVYNPGGTAAGSVFGTTDIVDDRWHFCVATYDGSWLRLYIDGVFEGQVYFGNVLNYTTANGPLNIGGYGADAGNPAVFPQFGRVSNAFVTGDVLDEMHVRNLYSASVPHALGSVPKSINLAVRRKRRGQVLSVSDFPSQPARLYNFVNGALTDQGSNNAPLTVNVGTGVITPATGADGTPNGGYFFNSTHAGLSATDTGLPAALTARSYGLWFKFQGAGGGNLLNWGTYTTADIRVTNTSVMFAQNSGDNLQSSGNMIVNDGLWHHLVVVEDNAAVDGVKRRMYIDGKLSGISTVMNTVTLSGGAAAFRIGAGVAGQSPYSGAIDGVFVFPGALTLDQVRKIYDAGAAVLAPSPKSEGDHIEAVEAGRLLVVFDGVETCDQIDLAVAT